MGKRRRRRVDPTGELRRERLGLLCVWGEQGVGPLVFEEPVPEKSVERPEALRQAPFPYQRGRGATPRSGAPKRCGAWG